MTEPLKPCPECAACGYDAAKCAYFHAHEAKRGKIIASHAIVRVPDPVLVQAETQEGEADPRGTVMRDLAEALEKVRAAITNQNGLNEASIADTVWVSNHETAIDCIDDALDGYRKLINGGG